jgi:hypothetical protein
MAGDGGVNRFRLLAGGIFADKKQALSRDMTVETPFFRFRVVDRFPISPQVIRGMEDAVDFVGIEAGGETADQAKAAEAGGDWVIRFDLATVVGEQNVRAAGADFPGQPLQAGFGRPAMGGKKSHRDLTDELQHGEIPCRNFVGL